MERPGKIKSRQIPEEQREDVAALHDRLQAGEERFRGLLTQFRTESGLTLKELAKRLAEDNPEYFAQYLGKVESGKRRPPRRDFVKFIAKKLELEDQQTNQLLEAANYAPLHTGDDLPTDDVPLWLFLYSKS